MTTYRFEPEHREFIQLLNEHRVDYMLIGGVAVNLYGYARGTGDLDILYGPSAQNKQRLINAIEELGYDTAEFGKRSIDEVTMFTLGERTHQGHIELTNRIAGITYDNASQRKQRIQLDGLTIDYIHYQDLLQNKLAAGRRKDLVDVEKLRQIREATGKKEPRQKDIVSKEIEPKLSLWQRLKRFIAPN